MSAAVAAVKPASVNAADMISHRLCDYGCKTELSAERLKDDIMLDLLFPKSEYLSLYRRTI